MYEYKIKIKTYKNMTLTESASKVVPFKFKFQTKKKFTSKKALFEHVKNHLYNKYGSLPVGLSILKENTNYDPTIIKIPENDYENAVIGYPDKAELELEFKEEFKSLTSRFVQEGPKGNPGTGILIENYLWVASQDQPKQIIKFISNESGYVFRASKYMSFPEAWNDILKTLDYLTNGNFDKSIDYIELLDLAWTKWR